MNTKDDDSICIVRASRTPIGCFQGILGSVGACSLGAQAVSHCLSDLPDVSVDALIMGNVLSAGLGQAPARQVARMSGLSDQVACYGVNKVCGSGLQAVASAFDTLRLNQHHVVVAGGMESMSQAPYLLTKARAGYRLGHGPIIDHLFFDGLEDAYERKPMGEYACDTAMHYQITRSEQDDFARVSLERAKLASKQRFAREVAPVLVDTSRGQTAYSLDELPQKAKPETIPRCKPIFHPDGGVTAANASAISDGAASVLLMRSKKARDYDLHPLATIAGYTSFGHEPQWFTTAPIFAIEQLLQRLGWSKESVDLYEINEAFAVVTLLAMRELGLSPHCVNVDGGACALGHPIGASGARLLVTLVHALQHYQKKRGVVALCIGGGEAIAMAVEACV